jgi:hypothetical protein
MWRELRFPLLKHCLFGLLAATVAMFISVEMVGATNGNEYRNVDYAYAVSLPEELHYQMNRAPNPNHGFRIDVAPSAFVWMDSSYTDDPTLSQAVDSERRMWEERSCAIARAEPKQLDGRNAAQITLKCDTHPKGNRPTIVSLLMALASPANRGQIRYEIGMQYPSGTASATRTEQVFRAVQAGFHFLNPSE